MTRDDDLRYHHESRGRTPLNLVLFVIGVAMLALALATADTMLVLVPLTLFVALMGYLVGLDPRAGIDIDARTLSFWQGRQRETVPLNDIAWVQVEKWSDSVDVTIHRHDGTKVDIPGRCRPAPGRWTGALKRAGVTVTES